MSATTLNWLLYVVYTISSVAGLIILKWYLPSVKQIGLGEPFIRKETILLGCGISLYVASFLLWLVILNRNDLSIAYPVAIGLTLIGSTLAAAGLLNEQISVVRIVGIVFVFVGVLVITRT